VVGNSGSYGWVSDPSQERKDPKSITVGMPLVRVPSRFFRCRLLEKLEKARQEDNCSSLVRTPGWRSKAFAKWLTPLRRV